MANSGSENNDTPQKKYDPVHEAGFVSSIPTKSKGLQLLQTNANHLQVKQTRNAISINPE